MVAAMVGSLRTPAQPPWRNPSRVSSSGRPVPCRTPSRVTWLMTRTRMRVTTRPVRRTHRSDAGQRLPHGVEAERPEVEGGAVERLEVERRALPGPHLLAGLEPDPLAHLVGGRLRRPAEVAVDLEDDGGVIHPAVLAHELQAELAGPALARVEAERVVARDLELEVHTDVDDHPGRAEPLSVEHPQLVGRVLEVAEVVHQPLGVQRPALTVPGHPAQAALPAVEHVAAVHRLRALQVVTGH